MIMPMLDVKDVDASIAFYKKLGCEVNVTMPGPDGKTMFAIADLSPMVHFGLNLNKDLSSRGSGVTFMVYVPDDQDIDAYYEKVKSQGIKIVDEIKTEYWGDRLFTIHDPDGYVLQPVKTVKQMTMEEINAAIPKPGQGS